MFDEVYITCCRCGKKMLYGTGSPTIVNDIKNQKSYPGELCQDCARLLDEAYGDRSVVKMTGD